MSKSWDLPIGLWVPHLPALPPRDCLPGDSWNPLYPEPQLSVPLAFCYAGGRGGGVLTWY